jgi:hypothetical protein
LEDRLAGGVAAACVLVAQGGLGGCQTVCGKSWEKLPLDENENMLGENTSKN